MRGFSLVELAVGLAIVALLLGTIIPPMMARHQAAELHGAREQLDEIRGALIGYAVSNATAQLPCPDVDGDGVEDRAAGVCMALWGNLPWRSLGTVPWDPWGNLWRYRVAAEFAAPSRPGFKVGNGQLDIEDAGDITVGARMTDKSIQVLTTQAPFVVLSTGPNGAGGVRPDLTMMPPPTATDELQNVDGDALFTTRTAAAPSSICSDTVPGAPLCEFDDLVVYVAPGVIISRLVAARRLP